MDDPILNWVTLIATIVFFLWYVFGIRPGQTLGVFRFLYVLALSLAAVTGILLLMFSSAAGFVAVSSTIAIIAGISLWVRRERRRDHEVQNVWKTMKR
jgi:FtsH-binding integral membrane protein